MIWHKPKVVDRQSMAWSHVSLSFLCLQGGIYEGEWRGGRPEGVGVRTYASGKVQVGWRHVCWLCLSPTSIIHELEHQQNRA
jgi:hypothetical protein